MHLYHSLNGVESVSLMECLMMDVLPTSRSFSEKMQAYLCIKS